MRTSHGLPHVRQQCLIVLEEKAHLLAPVLEPVSRLPLLFITDPLLARTSPIGSQIAPIVSPRNWHPTRALYAAPRPAPQPPCAQTALQATAHSSPDGIHAGLQTRRSRKRGTASSSRQTCTLVHDAKVTCASSCVLALTCPWSNARTRECGRRASRARPPSPQKTPMP